MTIGNFKTQLSQMILRLTNCFRNHIVANPNAITNVHVSIVFSTNKRSSFSQNTCTFIPRRYIVCEIISAKFAESKKTVRQHQLESSELKRKHHTLKWIKWIRRSSTWQQVGWNFLQRVDFIPAASNSNMPAKSTNQSIGVPVLQSIHQGVVHTNH